MRGLLLNLKHIFLKAMQKLVDRWTKCAEKDGDCPKNVAIIIVLFNNRYFLTHPS
jgi:hypothetical protein